MNEETSYSLQEIIGFCSQYLPALEGEVMPSEHDDAEEVARQMSKIFSGLSAAFPEAGEIYWGCRAWQLWMWQPVFIGVWAASVKRVSLNFDGFRHRMGELFTEKFAVTQQTLNVQTQEQAVFQTASHLKEWMQRELANIHIHYAMSSKLAAYFLGDAVLKALVVAQRFGLISQTDTLKLETVWQQALGLRCNGWLVWQEKEQEFLVEMISCCQHFRREGAEYCAGCPKTRKKPCSCQE